MIMSTSTRYFLLTIVVIFSSLAIQAQELQTRNGHYFKDGMLFTGTHTDYYESGAKKVVSNIKDGLEQGIVILYYENGQKNEERMYNRGLKDGIWLSWNESGVKIAEASYKNDKKHGYWYVWDHNGTKRYEMFYQDGEKAGVWFMWNEKGELVNKRDYSETSQ